MGNEGLVGHVWAGEMGADILGNIGRKLLRDNRRLTLHRYVPASPLRNPQTAGFVLFCRRNKSGNARIWSVGLGVTPVRAAYARSVTGVGRGPSKARPAAVELRARSVANFIVRYVRMESDARCSRFFVSVVATMHVSLNISSLALITQDHTSIAASKK
jgi:hypothetical protein